MISLRPAAIALMAVVLAACSASTVPQPIVTATAPPAASSTLGVASAAPQALPAANGATATATLAVAPGTPAGATVLVTASTAPPTGAPAISAAHRSPLAVTRTPLAYFAFVPSTDMQLTAYPTITILFPVSVLPAGTTLHEAFLDGSLEPPVYSYDIATGSIGSSGVVFTPTGTGPKLLAGKSYVFVFYTESGSGATPTPAPTATPTAAPTATPSNAPTTAPTFNPASDITVPASISTQASGSVNVTDIAVFSGFAGTHVFGRGGLSSTNGGMPSLITDCSLTVSSTTLTVNGAGQSVVAPLISNNGNLKTLIIGFPDTLNLGGSQLLSFYDASGAGINVGVFGGHVTSVSGLKTGTVIACNSEFGTNGITDRSLDTLSFSASTIGAFTTAAGSNMVFTQNSITPSNLGGASGTAIFGRGELTTGSTTVFITDCKVVVSAGTITLTGGAFSNSATFTGLSTDKVTVITVQGHPTGYAFQPLNGKVSLTVDNFGFAEQAQSTGGGMTLSCPA